MASLPLQPPSSFNFQKPDEWPKWKRRFEQCRTASGLSKKPDDQQICTWFYCLGEEAEDVLTSTNIMAEERKVYSGVLKGLDNHFIVRRNVIFERARFNQRNQPADETSDHYITVLYNLAENCNYREMKEEMIRHLLVVGIRDSALSERLQLDSDLNLEKAKPLIRQRKAVHE